MVENLIKLRRPDHEDHEALQKFQIRWIAEIYTRSHYNQLSKFKEKGLWKQQVKNDSSSTSDHPLDSQQISQQTLCKWRKRRMIYLKCWRGLVWEQRNRQPRTLLLAKLSFRKKRYKHFQRQTKAEEVHPPPDILYKKC